MSQLMSTAQVGGTPGHQYAPEATAWTPRERSGNENEQPVHDYSFNCLPDLTITHFPRSKNAYRPMIRRLAIMRV